MGHIFKGQDACPLKMGQIYYPETSVKIATQRRVISGQRIGHILKNQDVWPLKMEYTLHPNVGKELPQDAV
jgi:hypothetical protein